MKLKPFTETVHYGDVALGLSGVIVGRPSALRLLFPFCRAPALPADPTRIRLSATVDVNY